MSKKRKPLVQKHARKLFTTTAKKTRPQNIYCGPMRGGIRM